MAKKRTIDSIERKHSFFMNPYEEHAFTKCPKCSNKTKIRKFPLAIHVKPRQIFVLNKQCKYCPDCELIIAKQVEIENAIALTFDKINPDIIGNDYTVMGTLKKRDWTQVKSGKLDEKETIDRVRVFKELLNFDIIPAGWYRDGEHPLDVVSEQSAKTPNSGVKIITLRVKCLFMKDECIRVIEIPDNYSLSQLHDAIQDAVEFDNDHLFEFYAGKNERSKQIVFNDENAEDKSQPDGLDTRLRDIWPLGGLNFYYLFDFGDDWLFRISKERKIKKPKKGIKYPRVIESIGENPEQYPDWDEEEENRVIDINFDGMHN